MSRSWSVRGRRSRTPPADNDKQHRRDRKAAQRDPLLAKEELVMLSESAPAAVFKEDAPLGYTSAGPLRASTAYAGKSDLERVAQLMQDLELEPGRRHGDTRVLRASPPPRRRSRP